MGEGPLNALYQLTLWRLRDFLREPEALFWVFAFPVLLAAALGIAFQTRAPADVQVGVVSGPGAAEALAALERHSGVQGTLLEAAEASERLRSGRVAIVVVPTDPLVLRFDAAREESQVARRIVTDALQEAAGRTDPREVREERITAVGSRYIDFLIPGLLGMNIMGTGMWGIGFGVVKARSQRLLRRFLASPMRKSEFLLSHILARLVFLAVEVGALLAFAYVVFRVPVRGSFLGLSVAALVGAMAFAGLGLLVASRAKTIEGVSGLMNLVMVPMWILSGVFFSASRFPDSFQPIIRALPLTALNDALRAIMIDGAGLGATAGSLAVVAAWGLASFALALRMFRWR